MNAERTRRASMNRNHLQRNARRGDRVEVHADHSSEWIVGTLVSMGTHAFTLRRRDGALRAFKYADATALFA